MQKLIGMISRVAVWGISGAALGFIGVAIYEIAFTGGALTYRSAGAQTGAAIGFAVGAVIGFFRRS